MNSYSHNYPQRRLTPAKPRSYRWRIRRIVAVAVMAALIFVGYYVEPFSGNDNGEPANKVAAASQPVLSSQQKQVMASTINSTIAANPGMDIGVSIVDINSSQRLHYGLSEPFIAASVAKLLTASLYLHEVEQGKYKLSQNVGGQTAQYELQQMIVQSDNDAWHNLNDLLTHPALLAYAHQLGWSNYDPDQNTLTVDDISVLLTKLYKQQLLNPTHTNLLLSYMHNANEGNYIVASVPAGVKVYHKAGWLDDRVHDAAIIDNGKHPYVLVIFTKDDSGIYNQDTGHKIYSAITDATIAAFLQ